MIYQERLFAKWSIIDVNIRSYWIHINEEMMTHIIILKSHEWMSLMIHF